MPAVEAEAAEMREHRRGRAKASPVWMLGVVAGYPCLVEAVVGSPPRAYRWLEPHSHRPQSTVSSPRVVAAGFRAWAPLTLHRSE